MIVWNQFVYLYLIVAYNVLTVSSASLSIYEQKKYKTLIDGQGLYSADDDVEILTHKNFKQKLYKQNHAWIIEFYNSWCGFCQRFAPSWKALASDIRSWKDMIAVGAIDCADDNNSPICREFEIMAYPTLRYFHENFVNTTNNFGKDVVKGDDVNSHRQNLIRQIISEQENDRGKIYPNLMQYSQPNLNHLFEGVSLNTKYVFLIFENGTSFGPEVTLDLSFINQVAIKYTNSSNAKLIKLLNISNFPFMIVLSDDNVSQQFTNGLNSRESLKMAIINFLKSKQILLPDEIPTTGKIFTGKWLDAEVPSINQLVEAQKKKALRNKVKQMGDVVFQADLETTLRYSLKHEVGNTKNIVGDKRNALISFLNVLIDYFPFEQNGQSFLINLKNKILSVNTIPGKQIKEMISETESENDQIFSSSPQWVGCEGSTPEHRGYPCGLWKLFHFLTVNAADNPNSKPLDVLSAMYGYVKYYFGCADCSKHFQEMAQRRDINSSTTSDDAVLWLWAAHNEVNDRLAGDVTEDPEYPKYQFPSASDCNECRNSDGSWNNPEVLNYLKDMYRAANIKYLGSDFRIGSEYDNFLVNRGSSIFKKLDTSMCFILYVISFILIILIIRLFLKRGYRKKMYVHDILGKV